MRRLLARVLTCEPLEVDQAGSGEEALQKLSQAQYHLVLLDMRMPDMDGLAVLKRMHGDPRLAQLPVILVTATYSDTEVLQSFESGALYYLSKPFEPTVLVETVERVLGIPIQL